VELHKLFSTYSPFEKIVEVLIYFLKNDKIASGFYMLEKNIFILDVAFFREVVVRLRNELSTF
jgi:hypothetical protein